MLDNEILYQSFGLYEPMYNLVTSKDYKDQLDKLRNLQKKMIKNKTAVLCKENWHVWRVNNNLIKGSKFINENIKYVIRAFNIECEHVIESVKFNNLDSMEKRINISFETLNNLNKINSIEINEEYLKLKLEELRLVYEYQLKKQEEKEETRMLREQQREEAKLMREIEEKRRKIEKEQQHYNNWLRKLEAQISCEKSEERLQFLFEKKKEVEDNITELDIAIKEIDYREANQRAGYVYVISNIGAFGENIFKIGMTRRLGPQERIDELGSASVPFKFDVHAIIFSDNAPKLENSLHKAFESKKINAMNSRKEFFYVTLEEIKVVINASHDMTVDFIDIPPAQQFRETLKMREKEDMLKEKVAELL